VSVLQGRELPCHVRKSDPDLAPPPTKLRVLASLVERLGRRQDPEQHLLAKMGIARELRRVTRELER
jgi:hypothetical protein